MKKGKSSKRKSETGKSQKRAQRNDFPLPLSRNTDDGVEKKRETKENHKVEVRRRMRVIRK